MMRRYEKEVKMNMMHVDTITDLNVRITCRLKYLDLLKSLCLHTDYYTDYSQKYFDDKHENMTESKDSDQKLKT